MFLAKNQFSTPDSLRKQDKTNKQTKKKITTVI